MRAGKPAGPGVSLAGLRRPAGSFGGLLSVGCSSGRARLRGRWFPPRNPLFALAAFLHLATSGASKLRSWWIMTAGELCCICKSLLCIKGTSEQGQKVSCAMGERGRSSTVETEELERTVQRFGGTP
ncbi:unnamed protein product [Bubo scandiacus]